MKSTPLIYSVVMAMDGWNWILEILRTLITDITTIILGGHSRSHSSITGLHPSSNQGIKACMHSNSMWNTYPTGNLSKAWYVVSRDFKNIQLLSP